MTDPKPEWLEGLTNIDYRVIRTPLQDVETALINHVTHDQREPLSRCHPDLPIILNFTLRVARATWGSIRFLVSEKPEVPGRLDEFAVSVPPLARTILDSLFMVVFLFDNPQENTRWYFASGWRESLDFHDRARKRYAQDSRWKDWLDEFYEEYVQAWERSATEAEKQNWRPTNWWPHPGRMLRPQTPFVHQNRREYLEYLNDWFYKELSGDSHLSLSGLCRRGSNLTGLRDDSDRLLWHYKSIVFLDALTLYTALLSEVACQLGLPIQKQRLCEEIWPTVVLIPEAKDLFEFRLKAHLTR